MTDHSGHVHIHMTEPEPFVYRLASPSVLDYLFGTLYEASEKEYPYGRSSYGYTAKSAVRALRRAQRRRNRRERRYQEQSGQSYPKYGKLLVSAPTAKWGGSS